MLNAPICWLGGKSRLRKTIIEKLPEHTCYVEVFGGAGWVLFGKEPSKAEIYNDIDGELSNFFRILKSAHRAFIQMFDLILVSRKLFRDFLDTEPCDLDEIQRAVRFYYLIRTSFAGKGEHFGYAKTGGPRMALDTIDETVAAIHKRLRRVYIEEEDFENVVGRYDGSGTVFYLDPPYHQTATYRYTMTLADYERLASALVGIKGRFLLTINDHPVMRDVFRSFGIEEIEVGYSVSKNTSGRRRFGELLISNY